MFKIKNSLIIGVAFLFAACAGPYTYKDSGKSVELSVNDVFEVVLEGETNTGYSWQVVEPTSFVKLESTSTQKGKDDLVESTFHFKAVAQGQETLVLEYSNGEVTKKSFELRLVVGTLGSVL